MIKKNVSIQDYIREPALSSGNAKHLLDSPRSFVQKMIEPDSYRLTLDFGNAFELYLTDQLYGTSNFDKEVLIMPESEWMEELRGYKNPRATKAYKAHFEEFMHTAEGFLVIPDKGDESFKTIKLMYNSVKSDQNIVRLLKGCEYQVTYYWSDTTTGVDVKTRPDFVKEKASTIVDLKTAYDASPREFARAAANNDYGLQATFQIEGAEETKHLKKVERYYWVVVQKTAPYHAAIYRFTDEDRDTMFLVYTSVLRKAGKAMDHLSHVRRELELRPDEYPKSILAVPSYSGEGNEYGILDLNLPGWYKSKFD